MVNDRTPTTIQLALHVKGKNREETAMNLARAQLENNLKFSTAFEYDTHWFSEKKATSLYEIDIKHVEANYWNIKGAK